MPDDRPQDDDNRFAPVLLDFLQSYLSLCLIWDLFWLLAAWLLAGLAGC